MAGKGERRAVNDDVIASDRCRKGKIVDAAMLMIQIRHETVAMPKEKTIVVITVNAENRGLLILVQMKNMVGRELVLVAVFHRA